MSVDYSFVIGYGIVINGKKFEAVENIIEDINDRDDWGDKWTKCLDLWTGEEYFVGITYSILDFDEGVKKFDKDKYSLDPKDEEAFLKFYNKYRLEKFFKWTPECCAIPLIW